MIEGVRGSRDAYDITEYSYIKDAEYGVFAAKDSRLNIELSYFDKNLHHIWLENYRFALDRKISFCDFDKTGTMLLLPDFTPTQPIHGLYMNDIPGTKEIGKNIFNNSDFGMYAEFCMFSTKENTMTNVGTGIFSVNAQGAQTISDNEIENCDFGIDIRTSNGFEFQILDNTITTNEIDDVDPIGIYINDFEVTAGGNGIFTIGDYDEVNNIDFGNLINSNGQTGISLNGAQNSYINHNRVLMNEADADNTARWGILVNGGTMNEVKNNLINDWYYDDYNKHDQQAGQPCSVTYPCEIDDKTAITILDATYCRISCNRTNATHTGLQFVATTTNKSLHLDIRGNSMHWHDDGLAVGGSGYASGTKIGQQPPTSGSVTPGNYWKGNESGVFGLASTHLYNCKHPVNHVPNYPKLFFLRLPSGQQLFNSIYRMRVDLDQRFGEPGLGIDAFCFAGSKQ